MKLQKIILCVVAALAAFGVSLGLFELGNYLLRPSNRPVKENVQPAKVELSPSVVSPQNIPNFEQPAFTPTEESEPEEEDYSDHGGYYIIGENPKGFEDFENLDIITVKYDQEIGKDVRIKPIGSISAKKEFNFSWVNITGKRISFITKTRDGVSYQFDGKFIEPKVVKYKDSNGEEYSNYAVLKGRLTKWRNGVKIAEAKVKFAEGQGC